MLSSVQMQSYQLQPGDLIRDSDDGSLGLVLTQIRVRSTTSNIGTVLVQWTHINGPVEMDVRAWESGWVELVSRADVSII